MMGIPKAVTRGYVSPACLRYFQGMMEITAEGRRKGPIIAKGCGHYIHKADPELVIKELGELMGLMEI
jgi:hypothetical protein